MDAKDIIERLDRLETMIGTLLREKAPGKDWYSTAEAAAMMGKSAWTVRRGCELGEIKAEKRLVGRKEMWMISADELQRLRNYRCETSEAMKDFGIVV